MVVLTIPYTPAEFSHLAIDMTGVSNVLATTREEKASYIFCGP